MAVKWSRGHGHDDLDAEADGSLTASGALAGGTSSNETAQTAPGSDPASPLEADADAAPHIEADPHSFRRLVRGRG